MKKIVCYVMALMLAVSLAACGEEGTSNNSNGTNSKPETTLSEGSNGTEASKAPVDDDSVVHIKTPEDMLAYAQRVNGGEKELNAVLDNDIDMSSVCSRSSASWTPIKGMNGSFDGAGHTISNLYCAQSESCALFYNLSGTVSNLTLKNADVESTEKSAAGIAVEITNNAVISNCTVGGKISGYEYAAGIAVSIGNGCSVTSCTNESAVKAGYYNDRKSSYKGGAAGIVARSRGEADAAKITGCINKGTVTGTGTASGGIVGTTEQGNNLIESCANQGKVEGVYYVGGIAGYANAYTVINRCINDGELSGTNASVTVVGGGSSVCVVAGIAPFSDNVIINCANRGNAKVTGGGEVYGITRNAMIGLVNCYNTGDITSDNLACGVGYSPSAMQVNVYNFGSVICTADAGVFTDCFPWGSNGGNKGLLNAWAKENCIKVPDSFKDKKPSSLQNCCAAPEASFTDGTVLNALNEAVTNLNNDSFDSYKDISSILKTFAEKCDVELSKWVAGKNGLPCFDWE